MSRKLAIPAALLTVLALSACQDDEASGGAADGPDTDETTSESTETAGETEETEETEETDDTEETDEGDSGDPSTAEVTAPGTELAIGDSAILPLTYGTDGTAVVEITVTGITEGTSADLEAAKVDDAADYTPFYINMEMEILSMGPDGFGSYTPGSDFDGQIGDSRAGSLIVFGDFAPCESGGFESDSVVGDTATACVPALATKGSVVDAVQFNGGPDDAGYDQFDGEPVVWK